MQFFAFGDDVEFAKRCFEFSSHRDWRIEEFLP